MALTHTEKELAAVAISVAAGCKPCTSYHVKAAQKSRAGEDDIRRAVADAAAIRRGAGEIMRCHGLGCAEDPAEPQPTAEPTRTGELIAVGVAYAVNCTSSLKRHLAAAAALGVAEDEIDEVVQMAGFIKQMAASHVERLVHPGAEAPMKDSPAGTAAGSCCG